MGRIAINANRHVQSYARYGHPVFPDRISNYPGPLGGVHAALARFHEVHWILFVPCDAPALPWDLGVRLRGAATRAQAPIACAADPVRHHPTFALIRPFLAAALEDYRGHGERKVWPFYAACGVAVETWESAEPFLNLNREEDLAAQGLYNSS